MALQTDATPETNENISAPNWSEEEYKKICKQMKRFQMKKAGSKRKSKPILKPLGEVITHQKNVKVQKNPVDWDDLHIGWTFSLDVDATLIYTKTGRERAMCLNTMTSVPVGGAAVYRIFL